ncbi:MAG TPA: hypothetical protein VHK69_03245, partial [Chitinophagaceae bacterium]|nr:hypothetical protein [Chitinophagaceae bacterium]
MKNIMYLFAAGMIWGCSTGREVQIEMVEAELVAIDTVYRHPVSRQVLRWRCSNKMEYVSYASINDRYIVGARM